MVIVLMGVAGCGKTTVGKILAERLGVIYYDADDYHPESNKKKMASGEPLCDEDRWGWLESMAEEVNKWQEKSGAVLGCSALKKKYRDILRVNEGVKVVYLRGSKELILERMKERNHFFPSQLLDSQFDDLEEPSDEKAIVVDIDKSPEKIAEEIKDKLKMF